MKETWKRKPQAQRSYRVIEKPGAYLHAAAGNLAREDWTEARFEQPTRTPTAQGDVLVPLAQAAISGVFAGVLTGVAMLAAQWKVSGWYVVGAGVVVAAGVWSYLLSDHRRLLRTVETWTRRDLDGDGAIGEPQAETLHLEVVEDNKPGKRWEITDLPANRQQLTEIARRVRLGTHRLSRRDLASIQGIGSDRARDILAQLEYRGFIHYPQGRNHPAGAQWTARGLALVRALLE